MLLPRLNDRSGVTKRSRVSLSSIRSRVRLDAADEDVGGSEPVGSCFGTGDPAELLFSED